MSEEQPVTRQSRWRRENALAYWAHAATASALRRGIIKREPCEECGAEKVDAHHPDHRRPLEINWLCRRCHTRLHARARKGASHG